MSQKPDFNARPETQQNQTLRAISMGGIIGVLLAGLFFILQPNAPEDCRNGRDDDGDGWVDQADPDCPCIPGTVTGQSLLLLEAAVFDGVDDCEEEYTLTPNDPDEIGAIYLPAELELNDTIDLTWRLGFGSSETGGEGMAFVLHNDPDGTTAFTGGNGIPEAFVDLSPSVIIELDTHDDENPLEIDDDHLTMYVDGDLLNPVVSPISLGSNVEDGADHFLRIFWDPSNNQLQVFFDDMTTPLATYTNDLVTNVFGGDSRALFAAGAATGGSPVTNTQTAAAMNLTFTPFGVTFPVEWAGFEVEPLQEQALLKWNTASETNSHYFAVERAPDEESWEEIGRVNAAGNSSISRSYSYLDTEPISAQSVSYYRLKQVDLDGAINYSETKSFRVEISNEDISIKAYPNPAHDQFSLSLKGEGPHELEILTASGQVVQTSQVNLQGPQTLEIDASSWGTGLYLLRLTGPSGRKITGVWLR